MHKPIFHLRPKVLTELSNHPANLALLLEEAIKQHKSGNLSRAEELYRHILSLQPKHFNALQLCGLLAYQTGRNAEALELLNQALKINKTVPEAYLNQGATLKAMSMPNKALASYRRALSLRPNYAEAHNNIGVLLFEDGRLKDALTSFRRALALKPDYAETCNNAGNALLALGHLSEAIQSYRRAFELEPTLADAFRHLASCNYFKASDGPLLRKIEKILGDPSISHKQAAAWHFGLGKVYDHLGHYEKAFSHFEKANLLESSEHRFDRAQFENRVTSIINTFTQDFFSHRQQPGSPSELPVLIVGMMRSGTTLVEQILSSHPSAAGADELGFWETQADKLSSFQLSSLTRQESRRINQEYLNLLRSFSQKAKRITDKMPRNFMRLGLVHLIFPHARIIHCKRNGADTCLSIFFDKFSGNHPYAYSLDDLAFYYHQYQRVMAHWRQVLPKEIFLEVEYEELVANQENVSRQLVEFCGLEWNEKCLHFSENKRAVRTASGWQVRQPMYSSSVGRWKNYRTFIGPLAKLSKNRPQSTRKQGQIFQLNVK